MGPLYSGTLRAQGFGTGVDAVLAADPGERLPQPAQRLVDELVVWGTPATARPALDRWYTAGAELPAIVLPPGRNLDELEYALEMFRPGRRQESPQPSAATGAGRTARSPNQNSAANRK